MEDEASNHPDIEEQQAAPAPAANPPVDLQATLGHLAQVLEALRQNIPAPAPMPAPMQMPAPTPPQPQASVGMSVQGSGRSRTTLLPPPPPLRPYKSSLPEFIKSNRYFEGAFGKPDEAEDWLAQIERSFDAYEVPQHLRVNYGTYMLRLNARVWWESKRRELMPPVTWEMFRYEFLENYFPGSLRVQYSADFLHIAQKGRTIEQYETEFSRLLQYAPDSYKYSEELKRQVFLSGLDEDLRVRLEEFDIRTFRELVERARIVEGAKKRKTRTTEKTPFVFGRKFQGGSSSSYPQKKFKPYNNYRSNNNNGKFIPKAVSCWKCSGSHYPKRCPQLIGKCFFCGDANHKMPECPKKGTSTCYVCKQVGHFANECPQRKSVATRPAGGAVPTKNGNGNGNGSRSGTSGFRVYNMEGHWMSEEPEEEGGELAALDYGEGYSCDLVTGKP